MVFAVLLGFLMLAVAGWVFTRRSRYAGFACLRGGGVARERVVRLRQLKSGHRVENECKVFGKLNNEIKLFNKMHIVMPCRNGVAVHYINSLGNLVRNPRWVPKAGDGFAKLLYLYATANLMLRSGDALVRRQLIKNCLFVFGRTVIKRSGLALHPIYINLYAHRQARYKFLNSKILGGADFEIGGERFERRNAVSYVTFYNKDITVKHYVDKYLPVGCYHIKTDKDIRFAITVGADKMKYNLSHTADTFVSVCEGRAVGVYVDGRAAFGSSICEKTDDMKVYVNFEGGINAKIFVVHGRNKAEVLQLVGDLKRRGGRLDYLCNAGEARDVRAIEGLFVTACDGKFVSGEGLREKFIAATKYVPTLFLPTLVYTIEEKQDFFDVVDRFEYFRRIARAGRNINVVFMYSGMNDNVRAIINAFVDKGEARGLIDAGVFLFFVDKVKSDAGAVNYLSLMAERACNEKRKKSGKDKYSYLFNKAEAGNNDCFTDNSAVVTARHVSNSFPVTHSVFVRNTASRGQSARVFIRIDVGAGGYASVVAKRGAVVVVAGLKPGTRSCNFSLPTGAVVLTDGGDRVEKLETVCERFFVAVDVRLSAHEERVFKIVKNDGGLGRAERKQTFIGSIENLTVRATDSRFEKLFAHKITDTDDGTRKAEELLSNIKSAVRNYDIDLFHVLLGRHNGVTTDIWAFLVSKVLGIKLVRGKVQLTPCIQITGDFELTFEHAGTPYNFTVKQHAGGAFTINYGEQEYTNFVQVAVK